MRDVSKAGWEKKPIGEVCKLLNGRAYKKPELLAYGQYPVLRVGNFFTNNHWYFSDLELDDDKYCDDGDLLYAWSASFGPRIWKGGKVIYHYHIWKVLPSDCVARDFLYYFFDWDKELIKKEQGAGSTMIHVSKGSMEARAIPLPPLEEQQRIVAVLDEAFEGLARARAHAEANLQNARELFESFLGEQFLYGGVGNKICTVGDLITLQRGFDITKKDQREGPVPVVSSGGIKSHHDTSMAKAPGVVIGRKGSIGSVHFVEEDFWPHDTTLWVKDFKGNDPQLVYYLMRGLSLVELDTGAANPSLNRNLVHPLTVNWPDENNQSEVAKHLLEVELESRDLCRNYSAKLQDLDALRQSLLQKAFAGDLT